MPHKQARQHCGTPCVQHRVRRCFKVKHMRSIQATGKSVDAAIFSGLQQLGLSIDEVTINVIQHGTKGLLGIGAKPAIVELTETPPRKSLFPISRRNLPANAANAPKGAETAITAADVTTARIATTAAEKTEKP